MFKPFSGGPIFHPIHHTLYGIASFTHPSGCNEKPQGFTNILKYFKWIAHVTGIDFTANSTDIKFTVDSEINV